jgi:hypothetical protein
MSAWGKTTTKTTQLKLVWAKSRKGRGERRKELASCFLLTYMQVGAQTAVSIDLHPEVQLPIRDCTHRIAEAKVATSSHPQLLDYFLPV